MNVETIRAARLHFREHRAALPDPADLPTERERAEADAERRRLKQAELDLSWAVSRDRDLTPRREQLAADVAALKAVRGELEGELAEARQQLDDRLNDRHLEADWTGDPPPAEEALLVRIERLEAKLGVLADGWGSSLPDWLNETLWRLAPEVTNRNAFDQLRREDLGELALRDLDAQLAQAEQRAQPWVDEFQQARAEAAA